MSCVTCCACGAAGGVRRHLPAIYVRDTGDVLVQAHIKVITERKTQDQQLTRRKTDVNPTESGSDRCETAGINGHYKSPNMMERGVQVDIQTPDQGRENLWTQESKIGNVGRVPILRVVKQMLQNKYKLK